MSDTPTQKGHTDPKGSFSKEYSVCKPRQEDALVVPLSDWRMIESDIEAIRPPSVWYSIVLTVTLGLATGALFAAIGSPEDSKLFGQDATVILAISTFFFLLVSVPIGMLLAREQEAGTASSKRVVLFMKAIASRQGLDDSLPANEDPLHGSAGEGAKLPRGPAVDWRQFGARSRLRPPRLHLEILGARYGAPDRESDVTELLRSHVRNGKLSMLVSNEELGGDPAPGVSKSLLIDYLNHGWPVRKRFEEGSRVSLP